ncbi:hypothetical protein [Serratia quinivorans]|uniref:scabin-related ADP-ribosyltransferase n=1 Tax=Serratia quinivorans TaxID=137545 RepID=UPI0021B7A044|nr:hypothetical protein [Serratia quinivorans]
MKKLGFFENYNCINNYKEYMLMNIKKNKDTAQGIVRIFTSYPNVNGKTKKYIAWPTDNRADAYQIKANSLAYDNPIIIEVPKERTFADLSELPNDVSEILIYSLKNKVIIGSSSAVLYPDNNYPGNEEVSPEPYWYNTLPDELKGKINENNFYNNYLKTTMNLYVNLGFVFSDNKGRPVVFRMNENNRILFHGDEENRPPYLASNGNESLGPELIFGGGGTPPDVAGSLLMFPGYYRGSLESYTYSLPVANGYDGISSPIYLPSAFPDNSHFVYLSNAPGGIEVSKSLDGIKPSEAEVAFPGGVRSKWIIGVFITSPTNEFIDYIVNPHADTDIGFAKFGFVDIIISTDNPDWFMFFKSVDTGFDFTLDTPWKRVTKKGKYILYIMNEAGEKIIKNENSQIYFNEKLIAHDSSTTIDFSYINDIKNVLVISYTEL